MYENVSVFLFQAIWLEYLQAYFLYSNMSVQVSGFLAVLVHSAVLWQGV